MNSLADKILNKRSNKAYQLNASIPARRAEAVASALEFLMRLDVTKSKSAVICDTIVGYAESLGFESPEGPTDNAV